MQKQLVYKLSIQKDHTVSAVRKCSENTFKILLGHCPPNSFFQVTKELDPKDKLKGEGRMSVACHSLSALMYFPGQYLQEAIMLNQSPGNEVFIMIAVTLISNTVPIRMRALVPLSQ
jgi:hypothetical protein